MLEENKEETIKDSWLWVKNSDGNTSVTTTFALIAFLVTTLAYVLAIFETIGPLTIRPFDASACAAFFVPLLTLYGTRRYTEAKFASEADKSDK